MSFVAQCIQESLPIWEACLNSPFLTQLENGTLPEALFKGYLVEDSLYLREYARVFAWGMIKADTMEDIRICHSLLAFVNEGEDATRLMYLKRYGLEDRHIQQLPQRPQNAAYTAEMLRAAQMGGMAHCMMACLPCMISYQWIFQALVARSPQVRETVYWPLVKDYAGKAYGESCDRWIAYTDALAQHLSPEERAQCKEIFAKCSVHELAFWNMCMEPRKDI